MRFEESHRLLSALNDIDPAFITEAAVYQKRSPLKVIYSLGLSAAACLLVIIGSTIYGKELRHFFSFDSHKDFYAESCDGFPMDCPEEAAPQNTENTESVAAIASSYLIIAMEDQEITIPIMKQETVKDELDYSDLATNPEETEITLQNKTESMSIPPIEISDDLTFTYYGEEIKNIYISSLGGEDCKLSLSESDSHVYAIDLSDLVKKNTVIPITITVLYPEEEGFFTFDIIYH